MLRRLILLLVGLFFLKGQIGTPPTTPPAAPPNAPLQSFYYQYGGMVFPLFSGIDAQNTPDGWVATFLLGPQGDAEGVPLTEQDVAVLEGLMDEYALWSWAGFNESDPSILDGEHFSFSASYADGTRLDAHGSNSFPKDYWKAQNAILSAIEEMLIAHEIEYTFE